MYIRMNSEKWYNFSVIVPTYMITTKYINKYVRTYIPTVIQRLGMSRKREPPCWARSDDKHVVIPSVERETNAPSCLSFWCVPPKKWDNATQSILIANESSHLNDEKDDVNPQKNVMAPADSDHHYWFLRLLFAGDLLFCTRWCLFPTEEHWKLSRVDGEGWKIPRLWWLWLLQLLWW